MAGLGQTLRTTSSRWWVVLTWRLGAEHDFTDTGMRRRPMQAWVTALGVGQLPVIHTTPPLPVSTQCHDLSAPGRCQKQSMSALDIAQKHSNQCAGKTQSFARPATQFLHQIRTGVCVCLDDSGLQPPWVDVTLRGLSAQLLHLHLRQKDKTHASLHRNPWSLSLSPTCHKAFILRSPQSPTTMRLAFSPVDGNPTPSST